MQKTVLAVYISLASFSSLFAQNAILHESNNLLVKSLYSSLVVGEETAIFYEILNKDLGDIKPIVVLNGTLIDSLQSPIAIAADKGPQVLLAFVFRKGGITTGVETVWIPVTSDHSTRFMFTDQGRPFEKEGEVRLMTDLRIQPIIGTNSSHCKNLNFMITASLVSGGVSKVETTSTSTGIDMQPIRMQAKDHDQISVKITRIRCVQSDNNVIEINIPLADTYVKAKFTDVKTLPTLFVDKK